MITFKPIYPLLLLSLSISTTLAAPSESLAERGLPSGTVVCGRNAYSVDQIEDAINAGAEDLDFDITSRMYMTSFYVGLRTVVLNHDQRLDDR